MRIVLPFLSVLILFGLSCESKKKSRPPTPTSPISAEVATPSSPQSGDVSITYNLIDDRTPSVNADIKVYYSANGSGFRLATEGSGGDGTTNLATSPTPGTTHTFVWDSLADLGVGVFSVVIRIVPYETGTNEMGYKGETAAFEVVNAEASVTVQTRVFDPKMSDGLTTQIVYRVEPTGVDFEVTVKVVSVSSGLEVRRLVDAQTKAGGTDFTVQWDGKNDGGKFTDTGEHRVVVEAVYQSISAQTAEETIHIVRLGIVGVHFKDNGTENEFQMMFHIRNTTKYTYYAIPDDRPEWAMGKESGDVSDLDLNSGLPRPLPAVWTNLNSPPQDSSDPAGVEDDNYNLPVCYKRGVTPKFELTLGSSAASNLTPNTAIGCGYPLTGIPIRVLVEGATPETAGSNEGVSPADKVTFIATAALPNEIKKNTLNYTVRFEYQDGGGWHQIPGSIVTEHTVYTIYDKPMLTESPTPTPPYLPWVKCVDMVCGWVNGAATFEQLCSIITDRVNTYFGLQYDTASGASYYTTTATFPQQSMKMSDFIEDYDTSNFTVVNCSDCACLVSTFANHIGVDHKYLILGYTTGSIPLNYQKPIGRDWMIPFYGYFNYHAVATKDDGATISDACCVLDNDGNPSSPPHTALLPVNLPYDTYNSLLSWDPSQYGTAGIYRCGQQ